MRLADLLRAHNIPTAPAGHHHTRPGWVQLDCPLCGPGTHRWHLGYCTARRTWACWRCGRLWGPRVLSALLRIAPGEAAALHDKLAPDGIAELRPIGKLVLPTGRVPLMCPDAEAHRRYVRSRNLDPGRLAGLWGIEALGLVPGPLKWRLFVPLHYCGEVASWTTRSIDPTAAVRYRSAAPHEEIISQKYLLYGEDYCRHAVIVCEGPADVWRVGPGAVATLGVAYTPAQIRRMARFPVRAICFDSTSDAQARAKQLAAELTPLPGRTYNIVLDSKDPGEATDAEIRRMRETVLEDV